MPLHTDQIRFSEMNGGNLRLGVGIGVITDSIVAAGDTVALLKSGIAAVQVHSDTRRLQDSIPRAIDYLNYNSEITDALLAPLTTTAGLIALTQQVNANNQAIKMPE